MRSLSVVLLLACACTKSNPVSCKDGYCQDERYPFCDVGGEIDGNPLTCIAVDCTPNEFAACRGGDEAIICNAAGDDYDVNHCVNGCDPLGGGCVQTSCIANTTRCGDHVLEQCDGQGMAHSQACELGCVDDPSPHCAHIAPKYLPDICDAPASTPSFEIDSPLTLDTGSPTTCNGGVVPQSGGPEICVVRYGTFSINLNGQVRFVGARAIAVVADDALSIAGALNVSASGETDGPGFAGTSGTDNTTCGGGGGAGFQTSGAAGGSATQNGSGCAAGPSRSALGRAFFAGGYRRATTGMEVQDPPGGGAGGGALLISCRGQVRVTGTIAASGGGGGGGYNAILNIGGGGGGSGGYVVLQGASISVNGSVFANGGGGGCGKPSNAAAGSPGPDGAWDTRTLSCIAAQGSGGAGGSVTAGPQPGGASSMDSPGGGGGAMGYFQTYTPSTVVPVLTPSMASPAFEPNLTIPTR